MMTKLAHMRANRKNNKGFSLVELIIVIAIMVALIAVMGPQYVKYIQKSRDSALASAAEDLEAFIKTAIADPDTNLKATANATIDVYVDADGKLQADITGGPLAGTGITDEASLLAAAGASTNTVMGKTDVHYTITVTTTGTVSMVKAAAPTT